MPNFFVLAATFDQNRLVEGHYLMLDLIKPEKSSATFERKFTANYVPLLVNKSSAINKYLFDDVSLSKLTALNAYKPTNRAAYDQMRDLDFSKLFEPTETKLEVEDLRQAVIDFYCSPNGGKFMAPHCLGMSKFTPK
jgi:hypothetical protein